MGRVLISCLLLLAAQGPDSSPPAGDAKVPPDAGSEAHREEARSKYSALRDKTPDTAAAQWKLALWCEQNGLATEAYVHYASVVRLDPRRDAAWRKLGFKKHGGRWMSDEEAATEAEQKKAEKIWAPILKHCHKDIHRGKKKAQAQAELDKVTDPAAIASVYREFAGGGGVDQLIAVRILGQIDSPVASRVLALLAVYGKTPEVRRQATETLRGRPPEEYLSLLVALMKDPYKYEVRPVGGPGSPGVLFVEGERFNVRRFYAPPPPPNIPIRPGDSIAYDAIGNPVISHPLGGSLGRAGVPGSKTLAFDYKPEVTYSVTQEILEAQRGAVVAQGQLQGDVSRIEAINDVRNRFNEVVMAVAKDASGKDLGKAPGDWRGALAGEDKYGKKPLKTSKRTLDTLIPLAYNPNFAGTMGLVTRVVVDS